MSVLKPRNRLIYFRVSEEEFLQFSRMCQSVGARSLSDLARSALHGMVRQGSDDAALETRLKTFDALISVLNDRLREMDGLLHANGRKEPAEPASANQIATESMEQTHV
jgi:hypothetical protein